MDVFRDGKQGEVPNKEEMLLCALRDPAAFDCSKGNEATGKRFKNFLAYNHDKLVSKVCRKRPLVSH